MTSLGETQVEQLSKRAAASWRVTMSLSEVGGDLGQVGVQEKRLDY